MVQASALGTVRMFLQEVAGGGIAPGDFVGQLAFWDGAAWVPVPPDGTMPKVDGFQSIAGTGLATLTLSEGAVVLSNQEPSGFVSVNATDEVDVSATNLVLIQAAVVRCFSPAGATYEANGNEHFWTTLDSGSSPVENMRFACVADAPALGVLGEVPQPRQSITGATTQDQVDSIVAALVAFGFVSDDR